MRLLLERVSNENVELMARERYLRQQQVKVELFEGSMSSTSAAKDSLQVSLFF